MMVRTGTFHQFGADEFRAVKPELGPVNGLQRAFGTALQCSRGINVNYVPGDGIGLNHRLDLGYFAIVFGFGDFVASGAI